MNTTSHILFESGQIKVMLGINREGNLCKSILNN